MPSRPAAAPSQKNSEYWDYWQEMVKASIHRETKELPAVIEAAHLRGKHVMEVGCGPGRLVLPFSSLAATITAVDESDWVINTVKKMVREKRLDNVQVVQSPLVSLPFDEGVSESTYCMWQIHHAKSRWEKIVKEMVRVTKVGAPIVVGFSSGEKELPQMEALAKPEHVQKCKAFAVYFPKWCVEQGWKVEVKKVPLVFEFKSPEWAYEVFSNTFIRRDITDAQRKEILAFLKGHVRGGKCVIEQELRLYVVRSAE